MLSQGLQLTVSTWALLQHKCQSQTRSLWVPALTPRLWQELLAPCSKPASLCSGGAGRCHLLQPRWVRACPAAREHPRHPRSGTRAAGSDPWDHPCLPARSGAESLIPASGSSVAPERPGSAVWGARKHVCIKPVCHSEVLERAELTVPRQKKVQIKK